jgi:hypothetical protein
MRSRVTIGIYLLCAFVCISLGLAFYFYNDFPVLIVAGESSVGTWVSGVLLSCCAACALVLTTRRGRHPWILVSSFFFLLAADEHFMFHERAKEWIIFSFETPSVIFRESAVIVGALMGAWISWLLWDRLKKGSRTFLSYAVFLGLVSVVFDVAGGDALWEECFKLAAELTIASALLVEAGPSTDHS